MAKLLVKTAGLEQTPIELRPGVNRVDRSPKADFQIEQDSVSGFHCDPVLPESGRDACDPQSTNGSFIIGPPDRQAPLSAGQTLRLGDVELFVENIEATVAIPKFMSAEVPARPAVLPDLGTNCSRHRHEHITHQCTHCKEVMCGTCVHCLRLKGGKIVLTLCPVCSGMVEPIPGAQPPKKKSLFSRVSATVKLKLKQSVNLCDRGV